MPCPVGARRRCWSGDSAGAVWEWGRLRRWWERWVWVGSAPVSVRVPMPVPVKGEGARARWDDLPSLKAIRVETKAVWTCTKRD